MPNNSKRKAPASRKKQDLKKFESLDLLTLFDVRCTVCMGIFIEPVTLPCDHTVCKECFERTIDSNALSCPLCRKYVGGWIRQRQKKGLLVNQKLWLHIQTHFHPHVQKKLSGEDDEEIDALEEQQTPALRLSEPGAIRLEYEEEQKRIQRESLQRQKAEVQASEQLIKELQEREEAERERLQELRRRAEEEDALIAQQVAAQIAAEQAQREAEDDENVRHMLAQEEEISSAFVRLPSNSSQVKGPMDAFLSTIAKPTRAESTSSTDSLNSEMHHFKPLDVAPKSPVKKTKDGKLLDISPIRVPVRRALEISSGSFKKSSPRLTSVGSTLLRPWIQKGTLKDFVNKRAQDEARGSNFSAISQQSTSSAIGRDKRSRSPDELKSPKRLRRGSPRKGSKTSSRSSTLDVDSQASGSGLSLTDVTPTCQVNGYLIAKAKKSSSSSDSETDFEDESGSTKSLACKRKVISVFDTSLQTAESSSFDLSASLKPLSLLDFTDHALAEERRRQEEADFELALKLQNELNAEQFMNRSYELRSIDHVSPRKNQLKVTPPRSKVKGKVATSSSKKNRQRQCTLEEAMSFSVKMELQGSLK